MPVIPKTAIQGNPTRRAQFVTGRIFFKIIRIKINDRKYKINEIEFLK